MKRKALVNRHLSALVAELGQLDEITVADAGLPVPAGVRVIDLAVVAGVPSLGQLIEALRPELIIEQAIHAQEASGALVAQIAGWIEGWEAETGKPIAISAVSHAAFKARTARSKAVIRTGECTPYANLILVSGVPF